MITLKAEKREILKQRKKGIIPAVLYGPELKESLNINTDLKEFKKALKEAGESSLITLEIGTKKYSVLIHDIAHDPLTSEPIHVDFYQPNLSKEIEVPIPLVFEGESLAIKDLSGTLIKEFTEIIVKSLPQNLPHEIKINISSLKTFADEIKVKDLIIPTGVKILRNLEDIVAKVVPPAKVEEELEKPIEEKVEDVEKVEKKKKEEEPAEEEPKQTTEEKK